MKNEYIRYLQVLDDDSFIHYATNPILTIAHCGIDDDITIEEDYCNHDCEQTRLTFEQYSKTADYLLDRYRVIVSDGATILFDDRTNTKTVVKKAKDDRDDIEKSILWAFLKSQGYSTKDLNVFVNNYCDKRTKKVKKDKK